MNILTQPFRYFFSAFFRGNENKISISNPILRSINISVPKDNEIKKIVATSIKPKEGLLSYFFSRFRQYTVVKIAGIKSDLYVKIADIATVLNKTPKEVLSITPNILGNLIEEKNVDQHHLKTESLIKALVKFRFLDKPNAELALKDKSNALFVKMMPIAKILSLQNLEKCALLLTGKPTLKIFMNTLIEIGDQLNKNKNKQSYHVFNDNSTEDTFAFAINDGQVYIKDGVKKFGCGTFKVVESATRLNDLDTFAWATIEEDDIDPKELGKERKKGNIADARKEQKALLDLRKSKTNGVVPPCEFTALLTSPESNQETYIMIQKAFRGCNLVGRDTKEIQNAAKDLANALIDIHDVDNVFCDLKPDNILFDGTKWLINDFGTITKSGKQPIGGTPNFLPPESLETNGNKPSWRLNYVSQPSLDFFSLGITLFIMMTGRWNPIEKKGYSQVLKQEEMDQIIDEEINKILHGVKPETKNHKIACLEKEIQRYKDHNDRINKAASYLNEKRLVAPMLLEIDQIQSSSLQEDEKKSKTDELKAKIGKFENYKNFKELGKTTQDLQSKLLMLSKKTDLTEAEKASKIDLDKQLKMYDLERKKMLREIKLAIAGDSFIKLKYNNKKIKKCKKEIKLLNTENIISPEEKQKRITFIKEVCRPLMLVDSSKRMSCRQALEKMKNLAV
ncbi:MAG: hypothetical protein H0W88_01245 [Parachlamydiaceae bacterium]|nr:hypothetical protein [Parachlamydiaceae bacterium]